MRVVCKENFYKKEFKKGEVYEVEIIDNEEFFKPQVWCGEIFIDWTDFWKYFGLA